jgi:carboxyl-terminal processing protease
MRLFATVAVIAIAGLAPAVRADDPIVPKGVLAVKIRVTDGQVVIDETFPGGPAEKAGLKAGDVFLKVNDYKVKDKDADQEDLEAMAKEIVKNVAGTKIKVTVKRDGKEMTVEATLAKPGEFKPKDG